MLLEETARSLLASKYSSCPLKKRPVNIVKEDTGPSKVTPVIVYSNDLDDSEEPENLSTKPEDLSKTGKYPMTVVSPVPIVTEVKERGFRQVRSPLMPSPQYLCKAELEPKTELSPSWHTPVPHYPAYISTLAYCPEPLGYRSPLYAEQFSPYYVRPASCSPPLYASQFSSYSPSSPTSSHTSYPSSPPAPEDLTSPGSVSSDSGVSACSDKKRRTESAPRYHCPDCDKSYSTYSGLTKHRQYHCASSENGVAKKSFSCKYCAKVYTSLGALKMHIRTHTLPCKCHLCGKAFSRPWLLQGHIRTHTGEKPFSCHHCRRAFADRSNLRAHLQTHSEVKKYSCTTCSKTFSRMSLLSKHAEGGCGEIALPQHYHFRREDIHAY